VIGTELLSGDLEPGVAVSLRGFELILSPLKLEDNNTKPAEKYLELVPCYSTVCRTASYRLILGLDMFQDVPTH